MSAAQIVRYKLATTSGVTNLVPATRIMCGTLPLETEYPAISINQITGNQLNTLKMSESDYLVQHRIQVNVYAQDVDGNPDKSGYDQVKEILLQVIAACDPIAGNINGYTCAGCYPDTEGPDEFDQETRVYFQSQDFIVSFYR